MTSITSPVDRRIPVTTNMGIIAARGKTKAAAIGRNADSITLNHSSTRGTSCGTGRSVAFESSTKSPAPHGRSCRFVGSARDVAGFTRRARPPRSERGFFARADPRSPMPKDVILTPEGLQRLKEVRKLWISPKIVVKVLEQCDRNIFW